ncbi:hypothetical protein KA977_08295 [Candidatus Dependentiae bacterium]|nr:hypothetical protein [Candidatus Dependentiae bacterium]
MFLIIHKTLKGLIIYLLASKRITGIVFLLLFFIFFITLTISATNLKPKIFFDIEHGERYEEIEDDFTDYDYDITKSYRYRIIKLGYKQSLDPNSDFSIILKNNDKNFSYAGDNGLSNYSNSVLGYYKKDLTDIIEFKIEINALTRKFSEQYSSDKENYWYTSGLSFKITPKSNSSFFTAESNIYSFKLTYKNQHYYNADYKDLNSKGIYGEWNRKINDALRIETRAKYNINRYDVESGIRQNSDKYNIGVRFEYDFNK